MRPRPRVESPRENVVAMHQPPAPEPAPRDEPRPGRHISLADRDDAFGDDFLPVSKTYDMDYLDAQLGLKAPGAALEPAKPPAWRLGRPGAPEPPREVEHAEVARVPLPSPPEPVAPRAPERSSYRAPWAGGLALVALGIAVLVHLFAPNAIPGFSDAEVAAEIHMRAGEWLLAGILLALVGLGFRR